MKQQGKFNLDRLERWMQEVIQHPEGAREGSESTAARKLPGFKNTRIEDVFLPSEHLSAEYRVNMYANMYVWRLMECIQSDFPAVHHALGDDTFSSLAQGYVNKHPSRHYSLNRFGAKFSEYVRNEVPKVPHREFIADLAALEWAIEEVFDAAPVKVLPKEAFFKVPADKWATTRLKLAPAFRMLKSAYPVNKFSTNFRDLSGSNSKKRLKIPKRLSAKKPECTALFRKHYSVYRIELSWAQYCVLDALRQDLPLGDALEHAASQPGVKAEELVSNLKNWFEDWTARNFFAEIG